MNKDFPISRKTRWGFDQTHRLNEDDITIKTLFLFEKQGTSLQKHTKRKELWIPYNRVKIVKGSKEFTADDNHIEIIPVGEIHRLIGADEVSIITEISHGHFDEEDIERLHSFYESI